MKKELFVFALLSFFITWNNLGAQARYTVLNLVLNQPLGRRRLLETWEYNNSKVILFLISSDWYSPIIVAKCFLHSIPKNLYKFYNLSLKVKWVYSLQYLFYNLFYIWQIYDSYSRSNTYGAKLSLRVVNI